MFGARGIVPIGYAAFAFALGVTVGMLVRRTAARHGRHPGRLRRRPDRHAAAGPAPPDAAGQLDLRAQPRRTWTAFTCRAAADRRRVSGVGAFPATRAPGSCPATLVDASGRAVDRAAATTPSPCPRRRDPARRRTPAHAGRATSFDACLAEINRLGYRQQATYQPSTASGPSSGSRPGSTPAHPRPHGVLLLVAPPPPRLEQLRQLPEPRRVRAATESQGARMEEMREAIADVTRGARDAGGSCR